MHRAGDASVRLPDRPSPKRLPLGEPSTSGAPHSVQAGHYESGVSGSSGPGAKSAQFPRSPCVESRRCPSPDRQGGTEDARGREADAFRGVRAAGIGSARFPPCAKDARGREADAFRGVRCGRDPREQIPSLRRGTHAAAKRTPSGLGQRNAPSRWRLRPAFRLTSAEAVAARRAINLGRSVLGAVATLGVEQEAVKVRWSEEVANCEVFFSHRIELRSVARALLPSGPRVA